MATNEIKNPCIYIRKYRWVIFAELIKLLHERKISLADLFNGIIPTLVHAIKTSDHPHIIKLEGVVKLK